MDLPLRRWSPPGVDSKDESSFEEADDDEDLYFGEDDSRNDVPEVLGINQYDCISPYDEEDLSTIDAGSYAEEHVIITPEKEKATNEDDGDDGETLPETPTTKFGSFESESFSEKNLERIRARKRCFLMTALVFGLILLGAIGILSMTLFNLRQPDGSDTSMIEKNGPFFNFEDMTATWQPTDLPAEETVPTTPAPSTPTFDPTSSTTTSPTADPTDEPTDASTQTPTMLRVTTSPTAAPITTTSSPTGSSTTSNVPTTMPTTPGPTTPRPTSHLDLLRERLQIAAPISSEPLGDVNSVQYSVLEWLADDPSLANYTTSRIVQRFALGTVFRSLQGSNSAPNVDTVPNWMTYNNECSWPQTRDSEICDETGNIVSIYLENIGFSGTIASEISLLSSLDKLFLSANGIKGRLPTELGLLSNLGRMQMPRNDFEGTLPIQISGLANLRTLALGNNNLGGDLPSELGLLTKLGTLDLRENNFHGTVPVQLTNITNLAFLSLESNHLSGEIPSEFGSLGSLQSLLLQQNSFTGAIADDICWLGPSLQISADCDEIECDCCQVCCYGCTDAPTQSNTFPPEPPHNNENAPVTTPAPFAAPVDTDPTNPPSTSGSRPCFEIQINSDCFDIGEGIDMIVESCDPHENDLIVMFEEGGDTSSFVDAVLWGKSCGSVTCNGTIADGNMYIESEEPQRLGMAPWPLDIGIYRLYLVRVVATGVVDTLGYGPSFQVHDELC